MNPTLCPLDSKCMDSNIIYQSTVSTTATPAPTHPNPLPHTPPHTASAIPPPTHPESTPNPTPTSSVAYIGLTSTNFKARYNNHMHTLRTPSKRTATALSSYVWDLKDASRPFSLKWKILARAFPYRGDHRECGLCIQEATQILMADYPTLNKRSELIFSCRHKRKRSFLAFHPGRPPDE